MIVEVFMKKKKILNILSVLSLVLVLFGLLFINIWQIIGYSTGHYFITTKDSTLFYISSFIQINGFAMSFVLIFFWKYLGKVFKGIVIAALLLGNPLMVYLNYRLCIFNLQDLAIAIWM